MSVNLLHELLRKASKLYPHNIAVKYKESEMTQKKTTRVLLNNYFGRYETLS